MTKGFTRIELNKFLKATYGEEFDALKYITSAIPDNLFIPQNAFDQSKYELNGEGHLCEQFYMIRQINAGGTVLYI